MAEIPWFVLYSEIQESLDEILRNVPDTEGDVKSIRQSVRTIVGCLNEALANLQVLHMEYHAVEWRDIKQWATHAAAQAAAKKEQPSKLVQKILYLEVSFIQFKLENPGLDFYSLVPTSCSLPNCKYKRRQNLEDTEKIVEALQRQTPQ